MTTNYLCLFPMSSHCHHFPRHHFYLHPHPPLLPSLPPPLQNEGVHISSQVKGKREGPDSYSPTILFILFFSLILIFSPFNHYPCFLIFSFLSSSLFSYIIHSFYLQFYFILFFFFALFLLKIYISYSFYFRFHFNTAYIILNIFVHSLFS
jgi:hypothetical protein